jgi:hypothetical protein
MAEKFAKKRRKNKLELVWGLREKVGFWGKRARGNQRGKWWDVLDGSKQVIMTSAVLTCEIIKVSCCCHPLEVFPLD